jgi:hypothetical protein
MTQEKKQEKEPLTERLERKELHREYAKDVTELDHFDIKITVEGIDIEITISTKDPLDCVEMAGGIIKLLREKDYEAKVVILP